MKNVVSEWPDHRSSCLKTEGMDQYYPSKMTPEYLFFTKLNEP